MMSVSHHCPGRERLQQHVEGRLQEEHEADLMAHLDTCPDCQQTMEGLACSDDTLWQLARELASPSASLSSSSDESPAESVSLSFLEPPQHEGQLGRLGHYSVLEVIGRGGMGIVLKARDSKLERPVAIKVLSPFLAGSKRARQRFLREARTAAAVRHDNVIGIHAVEEINGLPYLVMDYISGPSLQELLEQVGPLDLKTVLRIAVLIADGLAAAHAQGLIHRDIKPANILLEQGTERVKITDFGLARAVDDAVVTQPGVIAGTPEYMSPEQARGDPVDHRSDLFSLGSVLYAMVTGCSPFAADGSLAVLRRIAEDSPAPIRASDPDLPNWLSDIIARLHAKNPTHRFQSAAEVAGLLGQHLARLTSGDVTAAAMPRPAAPQGWWSRNRRVLLGAVATAILLGATVAWQVIVVRIRDKDGNQTTVQLPPGSTVEVERDGTRVATVTDDEVLPLDGHRGTVWNVAFAGNRALTAGEDTWVRVWDLKTAKEIQRFDGHTNIVYALAVTPDGRRALSGSGCGFLSRIEDVNWSVCLWEIDTGKELNRLEGRGSGITSIALSRDGGRALIGAYDGTVRLLDVENWSEISRFSAPSGLWSVSFSPDGTRVLTAGGELNEPAVCLWNVENGQELKRYTGHKLGMWHALFLPDGKSILTAGQDETVRRWETESGQQLDISRHQAQVARIAVTADGRFALAGTWGGEDRKNLKLWRLDTGQELHVFKGHSRAIQAVALSPDGRWALSGSHDGSVKLWKVPLHIAAVLSPVASSRSPEK